MDVKTTLGSLVLFLGGAAGGEVFATGPRAAAVGEEAAVTARPARAWEEKAPEQLRVRRRLGRAARMLDCVADSASCPELRPLGDGPQTLPGYGPSPFRGLADPSIRQDPVTGRLWMAYSWPNAQTMTVPGGAKRFVAVADIHLAHSDDGGASWTFDGPLWQTAPEVDPGGSGQQGFSSHEVVTLAPRVVDGQSEWFAAHLRYFAPRDDKLYSPRADSFQIRVTRAASPLALTTSPEARLGSAFLAPSWQADIDLSALHPDVRQCALFNEPALFHLDGTLYLEGQCQVYDLLSGAHLAERDFLALFATEPAGDAGSWQWRYVGKLADHDDAVALGAEMVMQADLVRSRDGSLLLLVSPSMWDETLDADVHLGCRALELLSLDPPILRRTPDGAPLVRATVTASDLVEYGPASSGYDPASSTGILLVRRLFDSEHQEMVWSLHATGLHP